MRTQRGRTAAEEPVRGVGSSASAPRPAKRARVSSQAGLGIGTGSASGKESDLGSDSECEGTRSGAVVAEDAECAASHAAGGSSTYMLFGNY